MVYNEPPRTLMLRCRELSIDAYVAEFRENKATVARRIKRELGVSIAPIPVPLASGESAAQFEAGFVARNPRFAPGHNVDQTGERGARFLYAKLVADEYVAATRQRPQERRHKGDEATTSRGGTDKTSGEAVSPATTAVGKRAPTPVTVSAHAMPLSLPGDALPPNTYMDLKQYVRDYRAGRFATYKTMTTEQLLDRFGVPVVPIFVPLAHGETPAQYELRFVTWLRAEHKTTLETLRTRGKTRRERSLRMQFAMLNGRGQLRFDGPTELKRAHEGDGAVDVAVKRPRRARDADPSPTHCAAGDEPNPSLDACMACGCDACLVRAMAHWTDQIQRIERTPTAVECACTRRRTRQRRAVEVLDLTSDGDDDLESRRRGHDETVVADALLERLQRDFDELNEQIVLNQQALVAAVDQLTCEPPTDVREMTRLHDENEEVRALIHELCGRRTTALALLVVYLFRHDCNDVEQMLDESAASDVAHVQRVSYEHCMALATDVAATTQRCAELEQLMDLDGLDDGAAQQLKERLARVRRRLHELHDQRTREFRLLICFDKTLRERVQTVLRWADADAAAG